MFRARLDKYDYWQMQEDVCQCEVCEMGRTYDDVDDADADADYDDDDDDYVKLQLQIQIAQN